MISRPPSMNCTRTGWCEEKDEFIFFFKPSWCKIARASMNWIISVPQTFAQTFAFSSKASHEASHAILSLKYTRVNALQIIAHADMGKVVKGQVPPPPHQLRILSRFWEHICTTLHFTWMGCTYVLVQYTEYSSSMVAERFHDNVHAF